MSPHEAPRIRDEAAAMPGPAQAADALVVRAHAVSLTAE
jgi:hypothetical protein